MSYDKSKMLELLNSYPGLETDLEIDKNSPTPMEDDIPLVQRLPGANSNTGANSSTSDSNSNRGLSSSSSDRDSGASSSSLDKNSGASSSSSNSNRGASSSSSDPISGPSSTTSDSNRGASSSSSNSNNANSNNASASHNGASSSHNGAPEKGNDGFKKKSDESTDSNNAAKLRFAEVSSWIGAGRIALNDLGLVYAFSTEADPLAAKVQEYNFNTKPRGGNPTDYAKIPDFDILLGSISRLRPSTKKNTDKEEESTYDRNRENNFKNIVKLLKLKKPAMFLFEKLEQSCKAINVEEHDILSTAFSDAGYSFKAENLNTYNFGLPQDRSRWYLVGIRNDLDPKETLEKYFQFPESAGLQNSTILDIIEEDILPPSEDTAYIPADLTTMIPAILDKTKPELQKLIHEFKENPSSTTIQKIQRMLDNVYKAPASHFKRRPLNKDGLQVTWNEFACIKPFKKGNKAKHEIYSGDSLTNYTRALNRGHVENIIELRRRLSLREIARLQGFPDWFNFPPTIKTRRMQYLITNSLAINVIRAIAEAMINYYTKLQTNMPFDEEPLAKQQFQGHKYSRPSSRSSRSNAIVNLGTLFDTIDLLEEMAKKRKENNEGEKQGEGLGKIPKEKIREIRAGYIKLMEEFESKIGKASKQHLGKRKTAIRISGIDNDADKDNSESDSSNSPERMDVKPDSKASETKKEKDVSKGQDSDFEIEILGEATRQRKKRKIIELSKIDVMKRTVHFMFDRKKVATYRNGSLLASASPVFQSESESESVDAVTPMSDSAEGPAPMPDAVEQSQAKAESAKGPTPMSDSVERPQSKSESAKGPTPMSDVVEKAQSTSDSAANGSGISMEMHGLQGLLALSGPQLSSGSSSAEAPKAKRSQGLAPVPLPKQRTEIPGQPRLFGKAKLSDLHVQQHPRLSDVRKTRISEGQEPRSLDPVQPAQPVQPVQQAKLSSVAKQAKPVDVQDVQSVQQHGFVVPAVSSETEKNFAARALNLFQSYQSQAALQPQQPLLQPVFPQALYAQPLLPMPILQHQPVLHPPVQPQPVLQPHVQPQPLLQHQPVLQPPVLQPHLIPLTFGHGHGFGYPATRLYILPQSFSASLAMNVAVQNPIPIQAMQPIQAQPMQAMQQIQPPIQPMPITVPVAHTLPGMMFSPQAQGQTIAASSNNGSVTPSNVPIAMDTSSGLSNNGPSVPLNQGPIPEFLAQPQLSPSPESSFGSDERFKLG